MDVYRNPFWELVKGALPWRILFHLDHLLPELSGFVTPNPDPEQIACQYPKPILLNTVRSVNILLTLLPLSEVY